MNWLKKYFNIVFLFFIALILFNANSYAEVIEATIRKEITPTQNINIKIPEIKPKHDINAVLLFNNGVAYFKNLEYDKSINAFLNAIKIDENFSDAYFNLGILYNYFQETNKAIIAFNRAYVINKNDEEALFYLIKCYIKNNDTKTANFYLKKMPKSSKFYDSARTILQ